MRVALVEPPATDPRSPHLAMASLQAAVVAGGGEVEVVDGGAEGFRWLLQPERTVAALDRLNAALRAAERSPGLDHLARIGPAVVEGVDDALAVLGDPVRFFDVAAFDEARELLGRALQIHSLANGRHRYGNAPIRYEAAGVDPARLADLDRVTTARGDGLFGDYFGDIADRLDRTRPHVVALSILNHQQIIPGLTLARLLKERGHLVVIGGTVYAKFAEQLRTQPRFFELFCAAVCAYEGETALVALASEAADATAEGRPPRLEGIPNLVWLDPATGTVEAGPVHSENVAGLPTPNFDGFDLASYLVPEPVLPILTGKGCYFNKCRFCDIPYINRVAPRPYRRRTPEQVAQDIASLWHRYDAHHFVITDEALAPRFLLDIGEALEDHPGVEPRLVGYARFEPGFDADTCRRLRRAGVRRLFFGLESGSQRMLDHMVKGVRVEVAHHVVRNCADAGIGFHLFSMVGLPEEERADADETLQFFLDEAAVIDHPRNTMDIHRFSLDLRTSYFEEAERFGIEVDRAALAEVDFPLDAPTWRLVRGLDDAQVDELITEYSAALRARFLRSRLFPGHPYPGFEEYSVLYADRFDAAAGRWRLRFALPPEDDPTPCTLSWCGRLTVTPTEGGVLLSGMAGERPLSAGAFGLLVPPPPAAPVGPLLEGLVSRLGVPAGTPKFVQFQAELRAIIDDLLGVGVLRLSVGGPGEDTV